MNEVDQVEKDIWAGDLLDRKDEGLHLQRFIENTFKLENGSNSPSSFVLNINSGWGQGKTWFLTRLADQLRQNHAVVYFDAWRNDFTKDALLSFVSIICDELSRKFSTRKRVKSKVEKVKTVFSVVTKSAIPIATAVLAKQLLGQQVDDLDLSDAQKEAFTDAADQLANVVSQSAVDAFVTQKNALEEFSSAISSLVDEIGKSQDLYLPICIMVDELDRCRPTYAIELLESVKHLFAIRGIFFIVATDTKQLSHSIKAVYGEGFDSISYLKRFFYAEFNLSRPDGMKLAESLFQGAVFVSRLYVSNSIRKNYGFDEIFTYFCDFFDLNVRDREQIFSILKTFVFSCEKPVDFIFIMLLICFKKCNSEKYERCKILRDVNPLDAYIGSLSGERRSAELKLEYQRIDDYGGRYPLEDTKTKLSDVIFFYLRLFSNKGISGSHTAFLRESHYVYQKEIRERLLSISTTYNDLESYFLLMDQAGRVSINS
ncbi:hypothetical protein D0C16_04225 [Cellvibrio sp. KY-GH-1]|uniref:KAP family P-loop NTPase fold protein n=1 Tax=Cellvibrio sp. KY-GH-1 TaxID=2303332 RepID=UPI0012479E53|nr:P-loop NTPase fold protein [Cellvibrio sp. KY-GH-1]QEY15251.1 hypothetical protein D0C16_04225 [Cellvibrio sp. KY-GH-1]